MDKPTANNAQLEVKLELQPGSPAWVAAEEIASSYQSSINSIRESREIVGHKLADFWADWYNNIMIVCFGLGGALIALLPVVKFSTPVAGALFAGGAALLMLTGLYILLLRKIVLEREGNGAIKMGYEMEYYSMVARNRIQDPLRGDAFNEQEFEKAKAKLLQGALSGIETGYEESRKIVSHMRT